MTKVLEKVFEKPNRKDSPSGIVSDTKQLEVETFGLIGLEQGLQKSMLCHARIVEVLMSSIQHSALPCSEGTPQIEILQLSKVHQKLLVDKHVERSRKSVMSFCGNQSQRMNTPQH